MKLSHDTIQYITHFENLTHAKVKDCFAHEGSLVFVVEQGNVQRALGKEGCNITRASRLFGKSVKIIGFHEDPVKFIKNLLYPIHVDAVRVDGSTAFIHVTDQRLKGKVFGRDRQNLVWIGSLASKYFSYITDVVVV